MNYQGSSRHLVKNSRSALLAAIELYNKPRIEYRDESFVILLLNAWELLFKAILSKARQSIYYPKDRRTPYRTLAMKDALERCVPHLPSGTPTAAIRQNLQLIETYRDNAVHFYNVHDFWRLVYGLAQPAVVNYARLLESVFGHRLSQDITWDLLPLGLAPPIDPVQYLNEVSGRGDPAIDQFIQEIARAAALVGEAGEDTGRLFTNFKVVLQSAKKVTQADAVIGVEGGGGGDGPLTIIRDRSPDDTHPLRRSAVLERIGKFPSGYSTTYLFQVLSWKYAIKQDKRYCVVSGVTGGIQYSHELASMLRKLTAADIEAALVDYGKRPKNRA